MNQYRVVEPTTPGVVARPTGVARLVGGRVALAAAAALAVSPLHLWYSQEARPYALMVLLVAVSYLALVACWQAPSQTQWAADG